MGDYWEGKPVGGGREREEKYEVYHMHALKDHNFLKHNCMLHGSLM
jgi:hypothetical protein